MKKTILSIALAAMCVFGIQNAKAQTFTGTLTNVKMNSKTYSDVNNVSFTLTNEDGEVYNLTSTPIGPIGKMPGTINVNATVFVDENGNISAASIGDVAGTLDLSIGGSLNIYMTSISGNVNDGSIYFVLDTYSVEILGIQAIKASVTFNGTKVSD